MRPDGAILSEEGADDRSRAGKERVWIVDPLDGSSDYGYSPHWSVHVALVVEGEPTVGAVAVPGWETTWGTDPAPQRVPAGVESGEAPRIVVSRSRSRFDGSRLQAALGADIYTVGSAGVKAMAVVRGDVGVRSRRRPLRMGLVRPVAVASPLVSCAVDSTARRRSTNPIPGRRASSSVVLTSSTTSVR